jgi:hypothetical protein
MLKPQDSARAGVVNPPKMLLVRGQAALQEPVTLTLLSSCEPSALRSNRDLATG